MIDFTEINTDGEVWELFARDFLEELGFFIDSPPDRGPDGGKDMLITEELKGNLNKYRFRWLVSCKHNATSKKSVGESDETNILERVKSFKADGFIGFYSTIPSSALNTRLKQLKESKDIKDFRIFDAKLIENYLIRIGYSRLLMRYLPKSYMSIKPKHLIFNKYIPVQCDNCQKDLILNHHEETYQAGVGTAVIIGERNNPNHVVDVYFSCKGVCDETLKDRYWIAYKAITSWEDFSDLYIPSYYLKWIMGILNEIQSKRQSYSDQAFEKTKEIILAISQIVMREMTEKEKERVSNLMSFENVINRS